MDKFKLITSFTPKGDQPNAINELTRGIENRIEHQVLLGVTGSGKTFTIANVIANINKPPLINDDIDRMRHSATRAVLERHDTIIVASVSCIYGIGSPQDYMDMHLVIEEGMRTERDEILKKLVEIQNVRSDAEFRRGNFRVRGDIVEVYPSFSLDKAVRIEFFGNDIDALHDFDSLTGEKIQKIEKIALFPNSHWITPKERLEPALKNIKKEMEERIEYFLRKGKTFEAQRIEQRTRFDLEMLKEFGYCHGIENYSRHLSGRAPR